MQEAELKKFVLPSVIKRKKSIKALSESCSPLTRRTVLSKKPLTKIKTNKDQDVRSRFLETSSLSKRVAQTLSHSLVESHHILLKVKVMSNLK